MSGELVTGYTVSEKMGHTMKMRMTVGRMTYSALLALKLLEDVEEGEGNIKEEEGGEEGGEGRERGRIRG